MQPIFPLKADGEMMTQGEAVQYFEALPVSEQDRILVLLQALVDAIKGGLL